MLFATVGQGRLFIWMMAAGAAIGLWYMLTALLRRILQAGFLLTLAFDLLFGIGAAVIFIAALVSGNYGQPRPFAILGTLSGVLLFAFASLPAVRRLQMFLLQASRKIMTFCSKNRLIKVIFK